MEIWSEIAETFINPPYIGFGSIWMTPAIALLIAYIAVLFKVYGEGIRNGEIEHLDLKLSDYSEGKKNEIIILIGGYVIVCVICPIISPFFDNESILVKLCEDYLQYEPLLAIGIFLFLISSLLNKANKYTQIEVVNKVVLFVIPISVGAGLFVGRIDLGFWPNWFAISFVGIVYSALLKNDIRTIEKEDEDECYELSYNPIINEDELFPQHMAQAERLVNLISESSSAPLSICLSGKWGAGKTSVINAVEKRLCTENKREYAFIRLNAMEIDTKAALLHYFMLNVKSCLKERGAYVGIASEYRKFLSSTIGTITNQPFGSLFDKKIFGGEKDYRKQKEELEELLEETFDKGKLVLIVDDIERCHPDTAREYLFLIKEVATMKNCISIFVTNYDILLSIVDTKERVVNGKNKLYEDGNEFLDKFFNERINLCDEDIEDIFKYCNEKIKERDPAFESIRRLIGMSPGTWCQQALERFDMWITKQEDDNRTLNIQGNDKVAKKKQLDGLKENREVLLRYVKNPRMVVKLYNTYRRNMTRCYTKLYGNGENRIDEIDKYVRTRNIGHIVAFISFVEVYMPEHLEMIIKRGAGYIELPLYGENDLVTRERQFLITLARTMVYEDFSDFSKKDGYIRGQMRLFIEQFLEPKADLYQLINPFTTQEEEWIIALNQGNTDLIALNWSAIVKTILEKPLNSQAGITIDWKQENFQNLLAIAEEKIALGSWELDKVFSIFSNDRKGRVLAEQIGIMQGFWYFIENTKGNCTLREETVSDFADFARYYSYQRVASLYNLFRFLPLQDELKKVETLREEMLNSTRTFEANLSVFIHKSVELVPTLKITSDGWYAGFQKLSQYIENYLASQDLLEHEDINTEVKRMIDSANELYCLSNILKWMKADINALAQEGERTMNFSEIDETIFYFKEMFSERNQFPEKDVEQQFIDFFSYLNKNLNISLNSKQIKQLHALVTNFATDTGVNSLPYRKVLLNLRLNNNQKDNKPDAK